MNEFLKTREQIDQCTEYIREHGLIEHGISCKNFDIANIVPLLNEGDILDMGSSGGSCILENAIKIGIKGEKIGIDIEYPSNSVTKDGVQLMKDDLMHTNFSDNCFDTICCLSVIEHEVDFTLLSKECARLLRKGGSLFLTFDYWPDRIDTTGLKLYGLQWNILNQADVLHLLEACEFAGLEISSPIDWSIKDAVINPAYCSPFPGVSYTFGIFEFIKK